MKGLERGVAKIVICLAHVSRAIVMKVESGITSLYIYSHVDGARVLVGSKHVKS